MMRCRAGWLAIVGVCVAGAAPGAAAPSLPAWLAGSWSESDGARWTEEFWTPPRAGTMLGMGRNGAGAVLHSWEAMRIVAEADGRIALLAAPGGRPPVRFALVSASATEIVFANPKHDYPQKIRYWQTDRRLFAETSLIDGRRPMRWTYERAAAVP